MRLGRLLNKIFRYFCVFFSFVDPPADRALQVQSQLAANESADADLANLATVVDELQGSRPGSTTSRNSVGLTVARFPILIG